VSGLCYKDNNGFRCIYLVDKFFNFKKIENIFIDAYFTKVKNVTHMMEKVNVKLLEDNVIY
jgi:hypothetical protein